MPAIPAWLAQALFSLAVTLLEKTGVLTGLEAAAVRAGDKVLKTVDNIKVYSDPDADPKLYPTPKGRDNLP